MILLNKCFRYRREKIEFTYLDSFILDTAMTPDSLSDSTSRFCQHICRISAVFTVEFFLATRPLADTGTDQDQEEED